MKLLLIFFIVGLSSYAVSSESSAEVCAWQTKRDSLIKTLTPSGQKTATTILKDLQYIAGAGVQPLYEYVSKKFNSSVVQLTQSADAPKFFKLANLYGVGNLSLGAGELRDGCQDAKDVEALIKTFLPVNQEAVVKIVSAIDEGFGVIFPVIVSINRLLDYKLYDQLTASENPATLVAIASLYHYDH